MPEYTYNCDKCDRVFTIICSISQYQDNVLCTKCNNQCIRAYNIDMPTIQGAIKLAASEIKTLGHLAQRNTETMTQDQKDELYRKHNSYKENAPEKPLPKGMKRLKKQNKIQWTEQPVVKQRRKIK
jgi:hypothetical protein